MSESRTFKLEKQPMRGNDVKEWQKDVKALFKKLKINCPIVVDGIYGEATRSYTAALCHAYGLSAKTALKNGVTPELRVKLRRNNLKDFTVAEKRAMFSMARDEYRKDLRKRWKVVKVHAPVTKILTDDWGYHPGVHDGVDVICLPDAPIFAMVKCKVIDVRLTGWWGKGAPSNPAAKAKGDGIIQLEVLETVGPFKKGMHIGYGHAEKASVKVGQVVAAGTPIGHAGLANAWHIHLMINDGKVGTRGIGNINPRACLDYAVKNG